MDKKEMIGHLVQGAIQAKTHFEPTLKVLQIFRDIGIEKDKAREGQISKETTAFSLAIICCAIVQAYVEERGREMFAGFN